MSFKHAFDLKKLCTSLILKEFKISLYFKQLKAPLKL